MVGNGTALDHSGEHQLIAAEALDLLDEFCWEIASLETAPSDVLTSRIFDNCLERLASLLSFELRAGSASLILKEPGVGKRVGYIRNALVRHAALVETRTALAVLRGEQIPSRYLQAVSSAVLKEASAACLTRDSRLSFIGSGPYPESAIALARAIGCKVTCVDHSPEAALLSEEVIHKLGLERLITIALAEAEELDYSAYSHIWVASLVPNKEALLETAFQQVEHDARFVVRYGNELKWIFNYGLRLDRLGGWRAVKHSEDSGGFFDYVVLTKALSAASP